MVSLNNISLKDINKFMGREGECYQGKLYVGEKEIGFWSQDAKGAIVDELYLKYDYSEEKLREKIKEVRNCSLESFMTYLTVLIENEKQYQKSVEKGFSVLLCINKQIHNIPYETLFISCEDLNNAQLILKDYGNALSEKDNSGNALYSYDMYTSYEDFTIGTPIKLEDITL